MDERIIKNCIKWNLDFNEFAYLLAIFNNWEIKGNIYFTGQKSNLIKKGLLNSEGLISPQGSTLLRNIVNPENDEFLKIHKDLENCLFTLTRKKQLKGFGNVYFMPTKVELKDRLLKFWKIYPDYRDLDKISKILQEHIKYCVKRNSFAPAIKYFILKENGSQLGAGYESFKEGASTSSEISKTFEL